MATAVRYKYGGRSGQAGESPVAGESLVAGDLCTVEWCVRRAWGQTSMLSSCVS